MLRGARVLTASAKDAETEAGEGARQVPPRSLETVRGGVRVCGQSKAQRRECCGIGDLKLIEHSREKAPLELGGDGAWVFVSSNAVWAPEPESRLLKMVRTDPAVGAVGSIQALVAVARFLPPEDTHSSGSLDRIRASNASGSLPMAMTSANN
jgi:hypothetical protein